MTSIKVVEREHDLTVKVYIFVTDNLTKNLTITAVCDCRHACNETTYRYTVSSAVYPSHISFKQWINSHFAHGKSLEWAR